MFLEVSDARHPSAERNRRRHPDVEGRLILGPPAEDLKGKINELVRQQVKSVVLDLARVTFVDSTGIGVIVKCAGAVGDAGGNLAISGATGIVQRTLDMCRVNSIVPMFATQEEAARTFGRAAAAN